MKGVNTTIKIALTALILTAYSTQMAAQKNVHFGLKAVPGIYWLTSSDDKTKNDGTRFGFGYGAMLEFGMTDNYYLVTGLEVAAAGAKAKSTTTVLGITATSSMDLNLQYLQLPLFLKMKTNEIGMIKYFGQFGLGTGIAISSKVSTTTTVGSVTSSKSDNNPSDIFPLRESLLIGAGLEYNLSGNTSIVAGLTFDNGFTNILKDKDSNGNANPSMKSKGVTLTVGILF